MSTETKKPFVMGFIGRSGSGKTTLAAAVLRILAARGWRVCAVKDAHHHIDLDTPGKDTWRYRESGASRVILRTPERWAVLTETPEGAPGGGSQRMPDKDNFNCVIEAYGICSKDSNYDK